MEKRYQKNPDFVYRRVADEFLLVPIRHQVANLQYIFVLNPMGGRIWELIDGQGKVADIRDQIVGDFEVSPAEAEHDLVEFLAQLTEIGAIKET
jgi:hypothetical protein